MELEKNWKKNNNSRINTEIKNNKDNVINKKINKNNYNLTNIRNIINFTSNNINHKKLNLFSFSILK